MTPYTILDHINWLTHRHNGIGASDAATICEASNYMSPYELWELKKDKKNKEFTEETQKLLDAGHDQEPITAYRYLKSINHPFQNKIIEYYVNKKVIPKEENVQIFTEFHHPKIPFLFCHPDLIIKIKNQWVNVEMKYIRNESFEWNFHDLTEDGIPQKIYIQAQFQMMVTGIKKTIVYINLQGADFYPFEVDAYPEFFPILEKRCINFWKFVQNKTPPLPTNPKDALRLFPNREHKSLTLQDEIELQTLIQKDRCSQIRKKMTYYKKMQEKIKGDVLSLMGENSRLYTSNGEIIASYSENPGDKYISITDVRKDKKLYAHCIKKGIIVECVNSSFRF